VTRRTKVPVADTDPSFFARFVLAFAAFFRVLFSAAYAGRVARLPSGDASTSPPMSNAVPPPPPMPTPAPAIPPPAPEPPRMRELTTDSALQLLGLLQRDGRLIDFLQEDIASYSDAEVGAAARVVHDSVGKVLLAHVTLERLRSEEEGARVVLPAGFSAHEVRLTGNVVGQPPFHGTLAHAGWRATHIALPKLSPDYDVRVIAPAEVEL
jgi:hypothetical protein